MTLAIVPVDRAKMENPFYLPAPVQASQAKILNEFGRPLQRVARMPARASYDAARSGNQTRNIWTEATGRSAEAEATPAIRATLRNRARYEIRNNSYFRGMVDTKAYFTVGRCPRLQIDTDDEQYDRTKERIFRDWADEIRLGEKARLSEVQMVESGEAIWVLVHNPRLRSPVKMDVILIEPDRLTGQMDKLRRKRYADGIEYDEVGNPISYDILDDHPGGTMSAAAFGAAGRRSYTPYAADQVIHRFRRTRPGQKRGVTELAPVLNLGAMLRRYSLAVLTAAETASAYSFILQSTGANAEPVTIDPMDVIDLEYGSGLTLPAGWEMKQMNPQQPATTYKEFKREVLNEVARCIMMPLNIALGDSSGYNYASGRLDHQAFFKRISIDQYELGLDLSTIYRRWNDVYQFTPGALRSKSWYPGFAEPHTWHFDGIKHVDPYKEAMAQALRLQNRTTTYAIEWAEQGMSSEEGHERLAREVRKLREDGLLPKDPTGEAGAPAAAQLNQLAWMIADHLADHLAAPMAA